ncbi:MAG TPA: hypothetical protein VJB57_18330 [Dehalococcoidia bacterium]|nr:hypothetical protein [Dehalococcoidia bacterium]
MSVESLPYTLLLLLAQFTAGVAALVMFVQVRGSFEPAFVRTCSWMTASGAVLLTLTVLALDPSTNAGSYQLNPDMIEPIRAASLALLLFSLAYVFFLRKEDEAFLANATGATATGLGLILLVLTSELVSPPAWSVAGPILALFAGALTLGSTMVAMIWGHWYLVKPSLEEGPLNELTLIALGALLAELAITALNAIIPVGTPFESDALLAVDLAANPGFWLRVGIGLLFPALLTFMAYKSSTEHSMMSATGLLYIAVGAVLAGEALGRGLLFVTGAPV